MLVRHAWSEQRRRPEGLPECEWALVRKLDEELHRIEAVARGRDEPAAARFGERREGGSCRRPSTSLASTSLAPPSGWRRSHARRLNRLPGPGDRTRGTLEATRDGARRRGRRSSGDPPRPHLPRLRGPLLIRRTVSGTRARRAFGPSATVGAQRRSESRPRVTVSSKTGIEDSLSERISRDETTFARPEHEERYSCLRCKRQAVLGVRARSEEDRCPSLHPGDAEQCTKGLH